MAATRYLDIGEVLAVERISKVVDAYCLSGSVGRATHAQLRNSAKAVKLWAEVRQWEVAVTVAMNIRDGLATDGGPHAQAAVEVIDAALKTLQRNVSPS